MLKTSLQQLAYIVEKARQFDAETGTELCRREDTERFYQEIPDR